MTGHTYFTRGTQFTATKIEDQNGVENGDTLNKTSTTNVCNGNAARDMNGGAKYEKIENQNGVDEYCGNGDLEMTSMQRRVGNGHVTNSLGSDSKICEY